MSVFLLVYSKHLIKLHPPWSGYLFHLSLSNSGFAMPGLPYSMPDSDKETSDVPGLAWAQSLGLGWALAGSGSQKPKPNPKLRAGPGLGLVGLKPGLMSQRSNSQKYFTKNTV